MKALLVKNFKTIGFSKWLALFIVCIIVAISGRVGAHQSYELHCLSVLTDHYYLLFFMIPMFLFICFLVIGDDTEIVIIRYKSYFRYFMSKCVSLAAIAFVFVIVQFIAIALSGYNLKMSNDWSFAPNNINHELFDFFSRVFPTPTIALVTSMVYMFFGLTVCGIYCMWVTHFMKDKWATKIIILGYIVSVLILKTSLFRKLPITGFNHMIILHHSITSVIRFLITIITMVILIGTILVTIKKCWRWELTIRKAKLKGITPYYLRTLCSRKNLIILLVSLLMVTIWNCLQSSYIVSANEVILGLLVGHGINTFHMISFLEMLIINGLPIYLITIFIEKVTSSHSFFITARLKSRKEMMLSLLRATGFFILFYGLLLIFIPLVITMVLGLEFNSKTISLLLFGAGLRLLDILNQALLIIAIYCISKNTIIGFVTLLLLNLVCILPYEWVVYNPIGISSLARISMIETGGLISHMIAWSILIISALLLFVWLRLLGHKKLLNN